MDATEFELELNDLETRVDRLRALYENWFRGYEKMEPSVARKDVERRVYAMRKELPRNTALRFRYHQLYQRYTTLGNYWQRTAKQIEEGTYRLQHARMRRRGGALTKRERGKDSRPPGPNTHELNLDESLNVDDLLSDFEMDEVARAVDTPDSVTPPPIAKKAPAAMPPAPRPLAVSAVPSVPALPVRPAAPALAAAAPKPPVPAPAPSSPKPTPSATFRVPGAPPPQPRPAAPAKPAAMGAAAASALNEERLKRIYDEYTSARRRNNEGEVRYDHMVSSIEKMLPDLQKKHQGKNIDFEVVVKDGRVGLKPKAK